MPQVVRVPGQRRVGRSTQGHGASTHARLHPRQRPDKVTETGTDGADDTQHHDRAVNNVVGHYADVTERLHREADLGRPWQVTLELVLAWQDNYSDCTSPATPGDRPLHGRSRLDGHRAVIAESLTAYLPAKSPAHLRATTKMTKPCVMVSLPR